MYDDYITQNHPLLYKHHKLLECGPGWYPLINELSDKLETIIREGKWDEDYTPCASQVKEKYGTLRFYMSTETEEMFKLIEEYEKKSAKICEFCGKEGKMREANGWYSTRCDECWETRYDKLD